MCQGWGIIMRRFAPGIRCRTIILIRRNKSISTAASGGQSRWKISPTFHPRRRRRPAWRSRSAQTSSAVDSAVPEAEAFSLEGDDMQRQSCQPRDDWRKKVEGIGLTYHSHCAGPYWDESACYELTAQEVDTLEAAANTLHFLCIDAAEAVIKNNWWSRLGIPSPAIPTILGS